MPMPAVTGERVADNSDRPSYAFPPLPHDGGTGRLPWPRACSCSWGSRRSDFPKDSARDTPPPRRSRLPRRQRPSRSLSPPAR